MRKAKTPLLDKILAFEQTFIDAYQLLIDDPAFKAIRDRIKAAGYDHEEIWMGARAEPGIYCCDYEKTNTAISLTVNHDPRMRTDTELTFFERHGRGSVSVPYFSVHLGLAYGDSYADQKIEDFFDVVSSRRLTRLCLKQIDLED